MQEYYKILNLPQDASIEEIEKTYQALKDKYSKERFYEGEIGNEAARQLTKVETAYSEIMASRKNANSKSETVNDFSEIESLIKKGDISAAQEKLDNCVDRNAEWHYLQSVVFYKKNWINESKKQLEIALSMDPHNVKYSDSLTKLKQKIEFNDRQFHSANSTSYGEQDVNRQMGGTDSNGCLTFCATWCCMDMLCSMCCR